MIPGGLTEWSVLDMEKVLNKIGASGTAITWITDGLDESEDHLAGSSSPPFSSRGRRKAKTIVATLSKFATDVARSRMKFILLSRPELSIELEISRTQRRFPNTYRIRLQDKNRYDIELLINKGLRKLRNAMCSFDSDDEHDCENSLSLRSAMLMDTELQRIRSYLVANSNGVILWVTIILGDLEEHASDGMSTFNELEQKL